MLTAVFLSLSLCLLEWCPVSIPVLTTVFPSLSVSVGMVSSRYPSANNGVSVYQCICWCGVPVLTAVFLSLSVCLLAWCPSVNSNVSVSISVSVGLVSGRCPCVNSSVSVSIRVSVDLVLAEAARTDTGSHSRYTDY